ncbi:MAG: cytochrome c oxidase subunit 4 [Actinomycetota bacterium]|nr:cytochrome c oxidase subunit 4 [Actinomycetota bacterium]
MRLEWLLFAAAATFYTAITIVYWIMAKEPAGTAALALTSGLAMLVGFYLWFTARHIDPRPEDQNDAEIDEGAGPYGFFSPHSWWPLPLGASAAVVALGMVFGWWLVFGGVLGLVLSVIGLVFEYYGDGEEVH